MTFEEDQAAPSAAVTVAGVRLTHPDRVLYPGQGISKRGLAAYYEAVAPLLLAQVAGRPLALVRCPQGRQRRFFYQQHAAKGLPEALRRVAVPERGGAREHVMVEDLAGLVALVQIGALELHPWGARAGSLESPDRLILDLDPGPGVPFHAVAAAAQEARDRLAAHGLTSIVKTTGGKGLHVTAPLESAGWPQLKAFARGLALAMAADAPARYTARAAKAGRAGRIFLDHLRNERGATAIAPWSPRARANAPVATPLAWAELEGGGLDPQAFTVRTAPARAQAQVDPWAGLTDVRQALPSCS